MMYTPVILKSGREVQIRPLGWDEFWMLAKMKVELAEKGKAESMSSMEVLQGIREKTLSSCVADWEKIRPEVSLPEALEMEKHIDRLSEAPVLEGNS